ncbi:MAG: ilvB operon leader peptide IvbL [Morganella sp. (in: enterobacteria)]|uniref:IlvB operon leader peptide IvbL n=1 Tax=Morganella psychrotolerans TaxID=368603 RepID=A0A5M9QVX5_9GAMM|nr:ilvB operon leader peptide IvbL [Morganella psychrotolerans]KAA8712673.1 ilvB operon leader peptide IvbL [Morganella psychrotolerans]HCM63300.1 ilvB operon leader peptide IvbL [Morganella sp. (in: enterobacteria)]
MKPFIRPQNVLLTTALSDAVVVVRVVVVVVGNAP